PGRTLGTSAEPRSDHRSFRRSLRGSAGVSADSAKALSLLSPEGARPFRKKAAAGAGLALTEAARSGASLPGSCRVGFATGCPVVVAQSVCAAAPEEP